MLNSVVLNEASLPFLSVEDCTNNLDVFFDILHRTIPLVIDFSRVDEIEGSWNSLYYAEGFNFNQWLNGITDIERLRQIQSVLSKVECPLKNINENGRNETASEIQFTLTSESNIEVVGLGFASLNDSTGLSFASQPHWMENSISITKSWDEDGSVVEQVVNVPNICTIEQVNDFLAVLEVEIQSSRSYFDDFKTSNNQAFPNLLFTESVIKVFKSSSLSTLDHQRILGVLTKLNEAILISNNLEELSSNASLRMSGESAQTMRNKRLSRLRRFKHPQLGNTIFEVHIKSFLDYKRMHILSDYNEKKICIGYFGRHLKTISE